MFNGKNLLFFIEFKSYNNTNRKGFNLNVNQIQKDASVLQFCITKFSFKLIYLKETLLKVDNFY
jgi:hypothetical protein